MVLLRVNFMHLPQNPAPVASVFCKAQLPLPLALRLLNVLPLLLRRLLLAPALLLVRRVCLLRLLRPLLPRARRLLPRPRPALAAFPAPRLPLCVGRRCQRADVELGQLLVLLHHRHAARILQQVDQDGFGGVVQVDLVGRLWGSSTTGARRATQSAEAASSLRPHRCRGILKLLPASNPWRAATFLRAPPARQLPAVFGTRQGQALPQRPAAPPRTWIFCANRLMISMRSIGGAARWSYCTANCSRASRHTGG